MDVEEVSFVLYASLSQPCFKSRIACYVCELHAYYTRFVAYY